MNAPLRRVGVVVLVLFGLLFANLNWVQALQGRRLPHQRLQRPRVRSPSTSASAAVIEAGGKALAAEQGHRRRAEVPAHLPGKAQYAHVVGYKPVNLGGDRHRAARERVPRRHQRQALRRPAPRHVHRRADRRRQRAADPVAGAPRRRRSSELTNNRVGADAGRRGRDRPAHRRGPGAGLDAQLRPEPAGQPRHRRRPRRRTTSSNEDQDKPLLNRALGETLPARLDVQGDRSRRRRWRTATRSRPCIPAGSELHRRRPPARRSATPRRDLPGAADHADRGADRVVQHRLRPARRRARRRRRSRTRRAGVRLRARPT